MFGAIWMLSIRLRAFLRRYMPTNILLAAIFTRGGLKWGVPAMGIAGVYMIAALLLAGWLGQGAPGWVNLLVLLFLWNALKFSVAGPVSIVWLIRVRVREGHIRRLERVPVMSEGIPLHRMPRSHARVMR
jgi:hypothetical protein